MFHFHRAVALGLTADDMVSIQNYTENLKVSKINRPTTQDTPDVDDLKIKVKKKEIVDENI